MKLWEYIKNQMMKHPSQKVCENDAEMTYEEIVIFAEKFAKKLEGLKCCTILCGSEMASGLALLSCFVAEVTAMPLSMRYGEIHCNKALDTISPDAAITDQGGELHVINIANYKYQEPKTKPALIMCTSGTTGTPKGAMLTESNILTNVSDICEYFRIDETDTILISRPIYHCAVLTGEYLTALVKGVKIRFYSGKFNPTVTLKLVDQYNITAFCGTPTLLSMMVRFIRANEGCSLKHICISGECMDAKTAMRISNAFPQADIYHIYGLTEACPRVSYLPPELFNKYPDCVGIPLKSVSIKILTKDGKLAGVNEVGVLWVKGKNIMTGYYNNLERTMKVLSKGWLCTGDLALINDAGLLKIKGRNDDLIIKAGMNIYPQEIESVLRVDPRVYDVCVLQEKDDKLGTIIVLNIAGDFNNSGDVRELCLSCLPDYQMPSKINLLSELPKGGTGKLLRS